MRTTRTLPLLLLLVALVGTGCDAPLEPESRKAAASATPTPKPPPSETASPSVSPTTKAPAPAKPSIKVPKLPKVPKGPKYSGLVLGGDVSWPQCPKGMGIPEKRTLGLPMPLDSAKFVIIGLTNGPGFTPNPCLTDQVQWVKERHLLAGAYAVSSYPEARTLQQFGSKGPYDGSTKLGALSNVGYQQARYNVGNLRSAGLTTPVIWIDVEPVPTFVWSADKNANAAVVRGAARGYIDAGYRIGAYSTQALWETVVGDLRLNIPEWRAAGQTSREEALRRCGPDRMFQGGKAVISQWVQDNRDLNITCPGTSPQIHRWFHQY